MCGQVAARLTVWLIWRRRRRVYRWLRSIRPVCRRWCCSGRTGVLTPEGDVAELAAAISRLLTDHGQKRAMSEAARRFVLDERSLSAAASASGGAAAESGCPMSVDETWQPLSSALDRLSLTGRRAEFWLRDDDAVEPTEPLDRLLAITGEVRCSRYTCGYPGLHGRAAGARVAKAPYATIAVHGWSHRNYAPDGEKKQELGRIGRGRLCSESFRSGLSRLADFCTENVPCQCSCRHGTGSTPP